MLMITITNTVSDETWPDLYDRLNAVEISFTSGMDGSDDNHRLPANMRQAMLMLIKHWYDHRDAVMVSEGRSVDAKEVPLTANMLLDMESARIYK